MTPHQTQNHPDGSVSIRVYPGGPWKKQKGPYICHASKFVDEQNRFVRGFHQKSVRGYLGEGEAA